MREEGHRESRKMGYFDSTPTFRISFLQTRYRGSAPGCHVARPRGFTIPLRGSRRGRTPRRRRPLRTREISIERFAETPRGWSWRVSANVSASGAEKLNSLPFLPRLSRSFSLPLAPSCLDSPPLASLLFSSLSFRCRSTTIFYVLLLPPPSTGTPSLLCGWLLRRAFSINCQVIAVGERTLKARCEPKRISLYDDRVARKSLLRSCYIAGVVRIIFIRGN